MDDKAARLRKKQEMFDALSALEASDEEMDPGREASEKAWRAQNKTPAASTARSTLARAVSDNSGVLLKSALAPPVSTRLNEPSGLRKTVSDISTTTSLLKTAAVPTKTTGKRKRGVELEMVPEAQRVFNGLHFYFFPNNIINPARRMRIERAQQYGATWHQTWNSEVVTHVVLDNSMTLSQLHKYLKVDRLPPKIFVVSENYPSECITYRSLSDPLQGRFAVKGAPITSAVVPSKVPVVLESPELKPPRQAAKNTPVTEDGEEQLSPLDPGSNSTERITNSFTAQVESTDELDEAIKQAKVLADINLDDDEQHDEDDANSDNEKAAELKLLQQSKTKSSRNQDKFQCMTKHTGVKADSPNLATINILEEMAKYYTQTRDEWRSRAYRQAISTLRNHDQKVCTREEALALPRIGPRLADKIEEIAFTNRLRRLDNAKAEPSDEVLQNFMGIYGAGRVYATKWIQQGYTTRDELLEKADLTDNQRVGILHYEDFQQRIPRAEVERHGKIVRRELHKIDPLFDVIVGGSYRRGALDSGDIDCMITRPNTGPEHIRAVVLDQLVPKLTEKGFIKYGLAITDKDDGSKWHGASCVPGSSTWRRIDLLLVPSDELGAALIYWTGNDIFNRSLRLLAGTKGMRLNQRGLYKDVMRGPKRARLTQGTLVEGKDERKIFQALGVPWRPPEHRIC